ncbi:MAG TPA: hypothetical protein VMW72_10730 [Sedimentisphaerales bacterium]|nr:hypothetical protein [Sedimentisphaerales bacterium]
MKAIIYHRIFTAMGDRFKLETERLTKSWMQYDRTTLRNYLVEDVEYPH